jgi:uncharacterized protein (TIGR02466 family)
MADQLPKHVKIHTFHVPTIDEFDIPDAEKLNSQLIGEIEQLRKEDNGISRTNVSGWHSRINIFERSEPAIMKICRYFIQASTVPLERYFSADILQSKSLEAEGWININPPHAYNRVHTHDSFDLSGVYFVKVPERSHLDSGCLEFLNPGYRAGPYSELYKKMHSQSFTYTPIEGRMLLFPSSMLHWVLPNGEQEDRISIACNLGLKLRLEVSGWDR